MARDDTNRRNSIVGRLVAAGVTLLVMAALLAPLFAQQSSAPEGPIVRAGTAVKVSEHVFVIPDNDMPGVANIGIVVGRDAVLVIDTGMGKRNGEIVAAEAQKLGDNKPMYLVTTHVHPEHDLGAHGFPASTKMIRNSAQIEEIAEVGLRVAEAFSKRSELMRELLEGADFRKADVVFDGEHSLDLGGVHVRLLAMGPNHTPGDTAAFVEEDGVVFAGDVAMRALPSFASPKSSLAHWLSSLDRLEALKPRVVVPSHGPIGDTGFIAAYREYLQEVRDRTAAAKSAGQTLEQATQTVIEALKPKYPETGRIGGAVRSAYAEAS